MADEIVPNIRVPYHGPVIEGSQDRDNFIRNLVTILTGWGGMFGGAIGGAITPPPPASLSAPASDPPVVTLAEIKLHIRIEADQTDDDPSLILLEKAARLHAQNVLQRTLDPATTGENVKIALLLLIAHWYRNRETASAENLSTIPQGFDALLFPERNFLTY